jgi:RNase H-like domain found in reverse transcriptase
MTKDCQNNFLEWTIAHEDAFNIIKALVISTDCLTIIDHTNPGNNNIFVICDISDRCTSMTLSFGPSWETAHPVAFYSMQLKGMEKNYPVHKNGLLAIIHALKKWCSDLLVMYFYIYTDHWT